MMRFSLNERGGALLITMALILMVSALGVMALNRANTDSNITFNAVHKDQALLLAEAGIERSFVELNTDMDWRTGFPEETLGDGTFLVAVTDSSTDTSLGNRLRIVSLGKVDKSAGGIEVIMVPSMYHPLYNHAIYAGNREEYDPDASPQVYTRTMQFGGTGSSADNITGDVFHNGHINTTGDAAVTGNLDAGGTITGNPPSGTATDNAAYLEPPDLSAMNYETTADYVVNASSPWDANGFIGGSDPRHIFAREFRADLAATAGYNFDNTNYFFGDPWEGGNLNRVSVSSAGNQKTYFIDGNLWIEPQGTVSQLVNGPAGGTQITIVVKGNIYFSDELQYQNDNLDGIAFVAMSDGESYTDLDGDNQYDVGEPILHDDGDGIYEGNSEGSGNIQFGDPNGGPLGNISGFLYADNNFNDYVLSGPDGDPQEFGVNGMLSAGNLFNVNRDFAAGHAPMTVNYDSRLQDGTLSLPGLPKAGTKAGAWELYSWREL